MRVLQTKQITNPLQQQVNVLQLYDGLGVSKGKSMDIELQGKSLTLCSCNYHRTGGGGRIVYRGYGRSSYYGSGEYTATSTGSITFVRRIYYYAIVRDSSYLYLNTPSGDYEWSDHE